jgi:hypothetical protein
MRRTIGFAAAMAVVAGSAQAATVTIDRFTDLFEAEDFITSAGSQINAISPRPGLEIGALLLPGSAVVGDPTPPATMRSQEQQNQVGLGGVLGGERLGTLTASTPPPYSGRVSAGIFSGFGSLSTAFGVQGVFDLEYGANTPLDADLESTLTATGQFIIDLVSSDMDNSNPQRSVPATITVTSGVGGSEVTASSTISLVGEGFYALPFGDFAGVDFSDVDRIKISFDQSGADAVAVDFAITQFRAVPAPGAIALMGLGGLAAARRRR